MEDESDGVGFKGWEVLSCAQMVMPINTNNLTTMFPERKWDFEKVKDECNATYGLQSDEDFIINTYGGRSNSDFKGYSNIFFSNGEHDPWSAGSPLISLSESIISFVIEDAAHHLDLRKP